MPPHEKEPQFFCGDLFRGHPLYCHNWAEYRALFNGARDDQIAGEASTYYLLSGVAVPSILSHNADARFIALVRNPIDMAYAFHAELFRTMEEDVADFELAWRLQPARKVGRRVPRGCSEVRLLQYREVCSLGGQIRRLCDLVPPAQRLIVVFDDLSENPAAEYRRVLSFLGLEDDGRTEFDAANANRHMRSRAVAEAMFAMRRSLGRTYRPLKRRLNQLGLRPFELLWNMNSIRRPRIPISQEFRSELAESFNAEITTMERFLGRDQFLAARYHDL